MLNNLKNSKKKDESSNKLLDWLSSLIPEEDDTSALSPIEVQYKKLSKELDKLYDKNGNQIIFNYDEYGKG